jgi:initiation factor 1A
MVKNKHGGNRHKKMASKNAKPQSFNRRVRFADKSGSELYAKVERVYGGNRALVSCNDGHERLMEWRRKFSGRNKRDNFIGEGSIVLVGKREWQIMRDGKKEKVDLLEVYNSGEVDTLKKKKVCEGLFGKEDKKVGEDTIEFTNDASKDEYSWSNVKENENTKLSGDINETNIDLGDDVNWDDI